MGIIKNIPVDTVFKLAQELQVKAGQIVSKTLVQNTAGSMTLFAFGKGEEIAPHVNNGDAFVQVLDGTGKFIVGSNEHTLGIGDALVMPANVPHSLFAVEDFKMLLVVANAPAK